MKTIANTPLPSAVRQPDYDRRALRSRIVHLGFGAFHRAHQALLTDRLLSAQGGDWGICEISLSGGVPLFEALRQQDHLYSVLEKARTAIRPSWSVRCMRACIASWKASPRCWRSWPSRRWRSFR